MIIFDFISDKPWALKVILKFKSGRSLTQVSVSNFSFSLKFHFQITFIYIGRILIFKDLYIRNDSIIFTQYYITFVYNVH